MSATIETGTAYPSRASGFIPGFFVSGVRVAYLFSFLKYALFCFVFSANVQVLCIECTTLPLYLDCPFLIVPSVFSSAA
jgi:hypothetical protein